MPIRAEWDSPKKTIIRLTFLDNWQWQELFHAINEDVLPLVHSVDQDVQYITDFTDCINIPRGVFINLRYIYDISERHPRFLGDTVIVGANILIRRLYQVARRLSYDFMEDVYFADTLDEARTLLDKLRDDAARR